MRIAFVSAAALAFMLTSSVASARDIPPGGFTVDDTVAWLQGAGYTAQVVAGSDGTSHITSFTEGVKFGVYLFDCKEGRCGSIQFSAGFATHGKFDISQMNEWNSKHRWGRGYYDSTNDPWVEMDVDLTPGGTYELLGDELATWNTTLANFVAMYQLK
jgi:hypothetical protein